ncbi:DsbA family protein [Bradyrhizobium sp. LHD-71]|uniref:DsbA family protein n=1 Tax=Bradyrhizobium sp. LHD-71 TaxID=3072141 RepID=UPI00280FBCD6|nr:DsbA family protein [Bradyrhizobium sp. LHD-71]MDQ8730736.1 DsbA family protein [Bradyrhizobium sp. LHD-71]
MSLTRRNFGAALAATVLAAACAFQPFGLIGSAMAQEIDPAELAKPAPLGDIVLGSANAPVTMIEYASLSCGHCAQFHKAVYPTIKSDYIDTGKVRFIFREYPLDLQAAAASMLARCVGRGDALKYHGALGTLFGSQEEWVRKETREQLRRIANQAGLDDDGFHTCLANQATVDALKLGMEHAHVRLKVDSTPTFFVNGVRLKGAWSLDEFRKLIDSKLKS